MEYFNAVKGWLLDLPWLEFIKAVFDLIKGIAWPAMLLSVVLLFKGELRDLIPRLLKFGKEGMEFGPAALQQNSANHTTPVGELKQVELFAATPIVQQLEDKLRAELDQIVPDKRIDVALRTLALAQLRANFERIYSIIFGSQIKALRNLNTAPRPVPIEFARNHFDQNVKTDHPDFYKDFSFEAWIGFLIGQGLVDTHDNLHSISELGREFLRYMVNERLPDKNP